LKICKKKGQTGTNSQYFNLDHEPYTQPVLESFLIDEEMIF